MVDGHASKRTGDISHPTALFLVPRDLSPTVL